MASSPNFPRFDGLMDLAKREGVDIRPTLLRVLTDLYVQSPLHTEGEERQFVELASRLIEAVDDATIAAVRSRLAIYPRAPAALLRQLGLLRAPDAPPPRRDAPAAPPAQPSAPDNLQALNERFFAADRPGRIEIIRDLENIRLPFPPRIDAIRAATALQGLEQAALHGDRARFAFELAEVLILPRASVSRIVDDPGGEPLVLALKLVAMPAPVFQRAAMFLADEADASVERIFRMARLYDAITSYHALVMLAIWRTASVAAARTQHRAYLYDDETSRARGVPTSGPRGERPAIAPARVAR